MTNGHIFARANHLLKDAVAGDTGVDGAIVAVIAKHRLMLAYAVFASVGCARILVIAIHRFVYTYAVDAFVVDGAKVTVVAVHRRT